MTFLPQTYQIPDSKSGYFKLKDGKNRFRILSPAITGYEYWNLDNKPVRQKEQFNVIPLDIKLNNDGTYSQIKHFWAFLVWSYDQKMVQILEITQASIQRQMKTKIDNREGKATENDFVVTRSGTGFDTEYDVDILDPSPVPTDAVVAMKAKKINLEALYGGGDPFSASLNQQESDSTFEHISDSLPDAQNSTQGYEKMKAVADKLSAKNEPVADDIQEYANEMENDISPEDVPF